MTDSNTQPDANERPAQAEQSSRELPQAQASVPSAPPQLGQRAAPGRRPLFRS